MGELTEIDEDVQHRVLTDAKVVHDNFVTGI